MVVGLLFVVLASGELVGAIVGGGDATEAVFVGLIHLLMPLRVANHLLLFGKHLGLTHGHRAMKMLTVVHVFAVVGAALQAGTEAAEVPGVVSRGLGTAWQHSGSLGSQNVRWNLGVKAARTRAEVGHVGHIGHGWHATR